MADPPQKTSETALVRPQSQATEGRRLGPENLSWGSAFVAQALGVLVAAIPFGVALSRAASTPQWRDDLPNVRDLGLVSIGVGGGLSTVVAQATSLIPLGSRTFRVSVGSAIALGFAAWLTYLLTRRCLNAAMPLPPPSQRSNEEEQPSVLASLLSAIAALTAALSPAWQLEGTVGGGAMWATCFALLSVIVGLSCASNERRGVRHWLALGALSGAAFAESPAAGLCGASAIAVAVVMPRLQTRLLDRADQVAARLLRRRPEPRRSMPEIVLPASRALGAAGIAALVVAALLLTPVLLRPLAPRAWADVGRFLSTASVAALGTKPNDGSAVAAWVREVGFVSLLVAAFGAAFAFLRPRPRPVAAALIALIALDFLVPARLAGLLAADPFAAERCLAIASIAVASAFGVHEITLLLKRMRVPLAKPAGVLVVMFHVTLIALTSEEAQVASDRAEQPAAEVWTDEAFGALPRGSAVLVRSPAIAWRLWAARLLRGERPDVLVIPAPLLGRGSVTTALLSSERATTLLLRDMALSGAPGEHALSALADARPLHVELFASWPERLYRHLSVNGMWLEYTAEPRGPADRKLVLLKQEVSLGRVLKAIGQTAQTDASTAAIVTESLKGQAALLAELGEAETAESFLARVKELTPRKGAVAAAAPRPKAELAPPSDKRPR